MNPRNSFEVYQQKIERNYGTQIGNVSTLNIQSDQQLPLSNPPRQNTNFVGRKHFIEDINKLLSTNQIAVLCGIGGIGKSDLAREYCHYHKSEYSNIIWLNFNETYKKTLVKEFRNLFDYNTYDDDLIFNKINQQIRQLKGKTLIVIDNFVTNSENIYDAIAPLKADIIITTRLNSKNNLTLKVEKLDKEDLIILFNNIYKGQQDNILLESLIHLCDCHTFTIKLLARLANSLRWSINELYSIIEKIGFNLIGLEVGISTEDGQSDELTFFDHLVTLFNISSLSESESTALTLASITSDSIMNLRIFCEMTNTPTNNISSLIDKGWIEEESFDEFRVHDIVKTVVLVDKPNINDISNVINNIYNKLKLSYEDNHLSEVVHSAEMLGNITKNLNLFNFSIDSTIISSISSAISVLIHSGRYNDAKDVLYNLDQINVTQSTDKSNDNEIYFSGMKVLIKLDYFFHVGQFKDAMDLINEYDEFFKQNAILLENQYTLYITSKAMILSKLHNHQEALRILLKSYNIRKKSEPFSNLGEILGNLGLLYSNVNDNHNAMKFLKKSLNAYDQSSNKTVFIELSKSNAYENIGVQLSKNGHPERSLKYYKLSETIRKSISENHPKLVYTYLNIGVAYQKLADFESAIKYYNYGLNIYKSSFEEITYNYLLLLYGISTSYAELYLKNNYKEFKLHYANFKAIFYDSLKKVNVPIEKVKIWNDEFNNFDRLVDKGYDSPAIDLAIDLIDILKTK